MVPRLKEPVDVKWWQLAVTVLALLGGLGVQIWVAAAFTTKTETRIIQLEASKKETINFIKTLVGLQRQQSVIIIELKYNTKRYMKQQGIQYEELPDRILLEFMEEHK